jgi:trigger factor
MDQEFFDKVFGEGKVKEEADMQEQIREELAKVYDRDVDTHFFNTATEHLMKTKMALPVAFLKKWMTQSGENAMSTEEMEENWTNSEKGMRWQLIENKLVKDHHLHVHKEELVAFTVKMITVRMAEFGQANMGPEELEKMAANLLEDRNQAEQLSEQLLHDKMMTFFKSNFGIKESKSSIADFRKLVQKNK